jgi:hypothetical protein
VGPNALSRRAVCCCAVNRNVRVGWSSCGTAALGTANNAIQVRQKFVSTNWGRFLNRFARFGSAPMPPPASSPSNRGRPAPQPLG